MVCTATLKGLSPRMAMEDQSQEEVPENLKKQLALAVRSIQWSYAIFWSISSKQPGVLKWGDGYYNGDIKTRKTVQAEELNADQLGLQRSEQLRELYASLSAGETSPQAKRPSAALSPEDLTDAEWYYLVCMSFVFNVGQGLPGRTLAKNQTVWLCNAHRADTKVFSRSLLAKTIVCFPHLGGVVELGVTELVFEDQKLIQNIKTSFLDVPYPSVSKIPDQIPDNARNNNSLVYPHSQYAGN
ncbi:Transcription factor GLABRA 3 [Abeliophyllum distichum]|uniref:Transcription factor GLABRA 3 n=1 Tax=Abeliophyllum distichum TaxID=126358 RepID=A0ABD1NQN8_9LAMI